MWTLEPRTALERAGAGLALFLAVAGAVRLEELGDRLRREEYRAWWASNGRDVVNAAAVLVIAGALKLLGYPGPAAFLAGGLLTLALMGVTNLEVRLPERARPRLVALGLGATLALPLVAWPAGVVGWLGRLAAAVFPGG